MTRNEYDACDLQFCERLRGGGSVRELVINARYQISTSAVVPWSERASKHTLAEAVTYENGDNNLEFHVDHGP